MKFELEKVLHEIIRDLRQADAVNDLFAKGVLTFPDALEYIAKVYREEMSENN